MSNPNLPATMVVISQRAPTDTTDLFFSFITSQHFRTKKKDYISDNPFSICYRIYPTERRPKTNRI